MGAEKAAEPAAAEQCTTFAKALFTPETVYDRLATVVLIAIIALLVWLLVVVVVRRVAAILEQAAQTGPPARRRRQQRALTALSLLTSAAKWVIILGSALWALIVIGLGPKLVPVLAGAGILGLAVGFGAQQLVRDLISGLFILLEGQYAVGDFIEIGAVFGQVMAVGLRVTTIRELDERVHFIPNGAVTQVTVYDDPWLDHIADVPIADPAQAEQAAELLAKVAQEMEKQYPARFRAGERAEVIADELGTLVRIKVFVLPKQEWVTGDEMIKRINAAFAAAGIKLAEGRPPRVFQAISPHILAVDDTGQIIEDQPRGDKSA